MKKGMSYIDLVMSVGIFVIYSVFLFVILKPGIQEEFDSDYLPSIIKQGIVEDAFWNITELPIFIDSVNPTPVGQTRLVSVLLPFNWTTEHITLLNSTYGVLDSLIDDSVTGTLRLNFTTELDLGMNAFTLLYSPDINNPMQSPSGIALDEGVEYTYQIGVVESTLGLSETKFNGLAEYDSLKEQWAYPSSKEFEIMIYNASDNSLLYSINEAQIMENKVYTMRWSTNLLHPDSQKEAILINIKTW